MRPHSSLSDRGPKSYLDELLEVKTTTLKLGVGQRSKPGPVMGSGATGGKLGKVLAFRPRYQTPAAFAAEVRKLVDEFDGPAADRRSIVNYVIRRCNEPRLGSNKQLITELEHVLDGFLDPWLDDQQRSQTNQ